MKTDRPAPSRLLPSAGYARARAWLPALPAVLFLAMFFLVPVAEILRGGFVSADGALTAAQLNRIAASPVYAKVLWSTFWISGLTALICVVAGYPVAYLLAQLGGRARDRWLLWIMLPFWTSYLVKTYAWMLLLSQSGALTALARALGLLGGDASIVPSLAGVLIGMVHALLPLAVMTMLPIMQGIQQSLGQAAETLGAGPATRFFTVFLPLSAPGIAAAGLLVFITTLGFFIVPALLGSPRETMVAQLVIASVLELFDLRLAGALSALLLLCSIVVFYVYDRLAGLSSLAGEAPRRRGASGRMMGLLIALGRLADPLARTASRMRAARPLRLYTLGVVAVLVLPVIIVIPIAFTRGSFVSLPPQGFSLQWFETFLASPVWRAAFLRSFTVGFSTAALALALGFGATYALTRLSSRWAKPLFALFIAPLIVPRIVVAIGLLYLFARLGLTGTDAGLVIGHTVLALPYVVVTLAAGFKRFDWRLVDAAQILGASPWARLRTVMLPMLAPSLISAFLFAFVVSFDDLTVAIFVSGGLNTTLPKQMWDDIQLAVTPTLAAVSTALVVVVALVIAVSSYLKSRNDHS